LDTEFDMNFVSAVRNKAHLYCDGLVILCVIQVASVSIVRGQYGALAVESLVCQWYGLVALYAAASWLALTNSPSGRTCFPGLFLLVFGACVCGYLSRTFGILSASEVPVAWYQWTVLSAAFWGRACCCLVFRKQSTAL
jgi:hypothetical protein